MHRRTVLKTGAAALGVMALGRSAFAEEAASFAPKPGAWRHFEIRTRVELVSSKGEARVWIPTPSFSADDWTKPGESKFEGNADKADLQSGPVGMVLAEWKGGAEAPRIEVVSRVSTRDRDASESGAGGKLSDADRAAYLAGTKLIPTDGVVAKTSEKIVGSETNDRAKAKAIYEWVVENTHRDAKVRGCGLGDIATMLESGNLGGKCADINALYVGLARAAGLPARDVYGIRVAPSKFGYKSLGANSETITKSQHCRAEVWLDGAGWFPVDPADVRKVVLEEPPTKLAIDDPKVVAARKALFGSWETNWLAYNDAHDVKLPGSQGASLGFFMYPQAETVAGLLDCLDPDNFKYSITAREVTA
ncbi:transglutaminase-like domain-containing protein [Methylopila sp. M107]|uniref:transglutaminase-like domain-containing protein n=1 Tax=Methylopila sp. M107 TaxID=1101190 RepID=UPI0004783F8B|nr:transglutaminase-like domain-containing protein [Methylopila sp. M107]